MVDQSKALPKVGMPELKFSVISDTWPHSKVTLSRIWIDGLTSTACAFRRIWGKSTMKRIIWTFWFLRWH
jgi:hypothetical protein